MTLSHLTRVVARTVAVAIVAVGFAPYAGAAVISPQELIQDEVRAERVAGLVALLARSDVAQQLENYGVSADQVMERVDNMTDAEILALNNAIDQHVAGGDVLAIIGAVFLVLLILELVGVTNIFSSF
ncbi:MAG: PA2779 family protein [Woeseiaceae bacterium]|jgi:hypothetical protein|nr:PA2779 family protein [Woeseiaceae bacterium]